MGFGLGGKGGREWAFQEANTTGSTKEEGYTTGNSGTIFHPGTNNYYVSRRVELG